MSPAPKNKKRRPKLDDKTATLRRITMLQLIPWAPASISTPRIHRALSDAGYQVEPRTVQRDLMEYLAAFSYDFEVQGKTYHWFWPKSHRDFSVRSMGPEAALVFALAEQQLSALLPQSASSLMGPYFDQAREVLQTSTAKALSSWRTKLSVISRGPDLGHPVVKAKVQTMVFEGLLQDLQIDVRYRSRGAEQAQRRRLHPLGIVSREGCLYLVATTWDYSKPFQYALHRFESVELLKGEPVIRPDGFSLSDYVDQERAFSYPTGTGPIKLKLAVSDAVAKNLQERPLSEDQRLRVNAADPSRTRIEATVEDTHDLRWWILGHGSGIRVIGPKRLQRDIRDMLSSALAQYDE